MSSSLEKGENPDLIHIVNTSTVEPARVQTSRRTICALGVALAFGYCIVMIRGVFSGALDMESATEFPAGIRGMDAASTLAAIGGCWILVSAQALRASWAERSRSGLWNRTNLILLETHVFALLLVAGLYVWASTRTSTVSFEPNIFRSAVCLAIYLLARIAILRLTAAVLVSGAMSTSLVLSAWFYSEIVRGPVEFTPWVVMAEWMLAAHLCLIPAIVLDADMCDLYIMTQVSVTINLPPIARGLWLSRRLITLIRLSLLFAGVTCFSLVYAVQDGGHLIFLTSRPHEVLTNATTVV